jgi:hypothetical protein
MQSSNKRTTPYPFQVLSTDFYDPNPRFVGSPPKQRHQYIKLGSIIKLVLLKGLMKENKRLNYLGKMLLDGL